MNQSAPAISKQALPASGLPTTIQTATGTIEVPPLKYLNAYGIEFVQTCARVEPETVAQWIKSEELQQKALDAQNAAEDKVATLIEQGLSIHEAKHQAVKEHLQPSTVD